MSKANDSDQQRVWERGWDEHERLQLLRMAKLPLSQKLEWLEQAHRLVRLFESQRKSARIPSAGEASDPSKQK